ncbi:MAG: EamA family transporter, partial [Bdellovibrionales bacterium]|nr:EamA family transporter [Bdellovibrionales bacterium]
MGIVFALLAAGFSSAKDLVSKRLSLAVTGLESAFASFLFALPFYFAALFIAWIAGYEHFLLGEHFFWLVLARSVTDVFAEWLKMEALTREDISTVSCLIATSPLFLLVTSPLITGDSLTSTAIFATL